MGTVILFIIILGILVFVHEFGHFIAARKSGMKVYEFALGFPPMVVGVYKDPKTKKLVWVRGGKKRSNEDSKITKVAGGEEFQQEYPSTLYSLNLLPLGGFCKIKGENGEDARDPDSFGYQKTWKKLVVLVAGVFMNFVLAAVVLGIGFMIGLPSDVSGGVPEGATLIGEPAVIIQQIEGGSAAEEAGFEMGDKILSIDGAQVQSVSEVIAYIQSIGQQDMSIVYERAGETQTLVVAPQIPEGAETPRLGVYMADAAMIQFPWYISIWKGIQGAAISLINIFIGFFMLIKGLILGQGLLFDVAGPVGIASMVGDSARLGINYLLSITAMISLSLAAINILPIPALDGGRAVFVIIEGIFKKPVPLKYEQAAHTIGFLLLMALIVVVTVRDVMGLFG